MSASDLGAEFSADAEWEIWYDDTFDQEFPRQIELAGRGLVAGLSELWARHAFEAIQPDGRPGFSRFWLWWKETQRSIAIEGDWQGLARVRQWLFGRQQTVYEGYARAGDQELLGAVAAAHARLALAGETSGSILAAAAASPGREEFARRLAQIGVAR